MHWPVDGSLMDTGHHFEDVSKVEERKWYSLL